MLNLRWHVRASFDDHFLSLVVFLEEYLFLGPLLPLVLSLVRLLLLVAGRSESRNAIFLIVAAVVVAVARLASAATLLMLLGEAEGDFGSIEELPGVQAHRLSPSEGCG